MDAQLDVSPAFPSGSLQWMNRTGANTYDLYLKSDPTHATADPVQILTHPFLFALSGVLNRALTFRAHYAWGAALPYFTSGSSQWLPSYSFDEGQTWTRLDTVTPSGPVNGLVVAFTLPTATSDTVWICSEGFPYTWQTYNADIALYQTAPFNQYITRTTIGTSVQGRPIYRFTVNDPAQVGSKKSIAMYRSGHDNEHWAAWIVRTALLWAAGTSAEAATFRTRRKLEVMQIPSPDTLYNGWMRTSPYQSDGFGRHLNRWNSLGAPDLTVEGVEQFAVHSDVETLGLSLFTDYHVAPAVGGSPNLFYGPNSSALTALDLATYDPLNLIGSVQADTSQNTAATLNRYSHRVVEARVGCPALIFDGGETLVANGGAMTMTTAQQIGTLLPQMYDAYLVTH